MRLQHPPVSSGIKWLHPDNIWQNSWLINIFETLHFKALWITSGARQSSLHHEKCSDEMVLTHTPMTSHCKASCHTPWRTAWPRHQMFAGSCSFQWKNSPHLRCKTIVSTFLNITSSPLGGLDRGMCIFTLWLISRCYFHSLNLQTEHFFTQTHTVVTL